MPEIITLGIGGIAIAAWLAAKKKREQGGGDVNGDFGGSGPAPDSGQPGGGQPGILGVTLSKARASATEARQRSAARKTARANGLFPPATAMPPHSARNPTGIEEFAGVAAPGSLWQRAKQAPGNVIEAVKNLRNPKGSMRPEPAPAASTPPGGPVSDIPTTDELAKRAYETCWSAARANPDGWANAIEARAAALPDGDPFAAALRRATQTVTREIMSTFQNYLTRCRAAAANAKQGEDWHATFRNACAPSGGLERALVDEALLMVDGERHIAFSEKVIQREDARQNEPCAHCKDKREIEEQGQHGRMLVPCPRCRPAENREAADARAEQAAKEATAKDGSPTAKTAEQAQAEQREREANGQGPVGAGASGAMGGDPVSVYALAQGLAAANIGAMPLPQIFKLLASLSEVSQGMATVLSSVGNRLGDEALFDQRIVEQITGAASTQSSVSGRIGDAHTIATGLYRAYQEVVSQARVPSREVLEATRNG